MNANRVNPPCSITYLDKSYIISNYAKKVKGYDLLKNIANLSDLTPDALSISKLFKSGQVLKGMHDSAMSAVGKASNNTPAQYFFESLAFTNPISFIAGLIAGEVTDHFNDQSNIRYLKYQLMLKDKNSDYLFLLKERNSRSKMINTLNNF
ncbi:MAG: hypothetical protein N4A50_01490 [Vallitalea sp.]|jgi:hypothetical protein|nr:hypothetical protein [Vallitalea sp.]